MKKALSLILSIALVLTLFTAIPVNAVAADETIPLANQFRPASPSAFGWGSVVTQTETEDGLRFAFNAGYSTLYSFATNASYDLNGVHIKYSINDRYDSSHARTVFFVSNELTNEATTGLFIKSSNGNERQFFVGLGGLSTFVNTSSHQYCYGSGITDRLSLPTTAMSNDINNYDLLFTVNSDSTVDVTINGITINVSTADLATAGLDINKKVYVHIASAGSLTDFTVNCIHGGGEDCETLVADINAAAVNATTKEMVNLYTKAQALSNEGKAKIAQYPNIVSAVYGMTDAEYYKLAQTELRGYNNWGTTSSIEDGVNMNFPEGKSYIYSHTILRKVAVDGLTLGFTKNSGYEYALILDNDTLNPSEPSANNISMKMNNEGKIYITLNGVAVTAENLKYGSLDSNGWVPASIIKNINESVVHFDVELDGALSMYINDTKIYTLNAVAVASCGLPLDGAYVKFAALAYAFNIDLHYLRSGNEPTFAEITDSKYYKASISDFIAHDYGGDSSVTKEDTDTGARYYFVGVNHPIYNYGTNKTINLDGAVVKYTVNSTSGRYLGFFLSGTSANGDGNLNMYNGIYIKASNSNARQFQVSINGYGDRNAIDHSTSSYCYPGRTDRLQLPDTAMSSTINEYVLSFDVNSDGSLTININGVSVTVTAEDVAASGIDLSAAHFHIGYNDGNTDATVNYIKDGALVNQPRIEKPVKVDGDANADMSVNILDFIRLKKHIADASFPIFTQAADLAVNEDTSVVIGAEDLTAEIQLLLFQ